MSELEHGYRPDHYCMARRGLVSKNTGPQGGGNAALMPKGEKPKGPELLPLSEVARRLRVDASQVETWLQKDLLRGGSSGIRPYDVKKFQLDFAEEIKKAQRESVQDKQTKSDRKPKKGFLWKFKSIFGGGEPNQSHSGASLAKENQRLKAELSKLKKSKPDSKLGSPKEIEDKFRFLEGKLAETESLKAEVAQLKQRLSQQPENPSPHSEQGLGAELEQTRRELEEAQRLSAQGERFKEALFIAQQEREELVSTIEQLRAGSLDRSEVDQLRAIITEREEALQELQRGAQEAVEENERLRAKISDTSEASPQTPLEQGPLVEELLALQRVNLERFRRLHTLQAETLAKLAEAEKDAPKQEDKELVEAFAELQAKYDELLDKQVDDKPSHQEVLNQLSSTRITVSKLKGENELLRKQMAQAKETAIDERVRELEQELREALTNSSLQQQMEAELASLKKGLQLKETQIQKVAGKLAENEKSLTKAMQESARLTELLIERENRLRELSDEFEQEYRDKLENLDRQVSGLQWKLSLREERIAHLEGELLRKGS